MKILVISDSHGHVNTVFDIIYENADADVIIHLGDGVGDADEAAREVAGCRSLNVKRIIKVRGNCDMFSDEAVTLYENIGGKRFYITHGFRQGVKSAAGIDGMCAEAAKAGLDAALFGHTHKPYFEENCGIYAFNPGAAQRGLYGVIIIDDKTGNMTFEHKEITA